MITKQEMFDRAVLGLMRQSWRQSKVGANCLYLSPNGDRCAWGHVDPEHTKNRGSVALSELVRYRIGTAAYFNPYSNDPNHKFAVALQSTHDCWRPEGTETMESRFRALGEKEGLQWPI